MAHLHTHTLPDSQETGAAVVDPDNDTLHWHLVGGERTSKDAFGAGHTHTLDGVETSGPNDSPQEQRMKKEYATLSFRAEEIKELHENNTNIGVFSGHLAAFAQDRMDDVFMPGAFQNSIDRHRRDNNRPIRMLFQHDSDFLIGGFPIELVREDEKGLFVVGNINLDVQRGKEAFALMKQGVLTDMSIGFTIMADGAVFKDGIRFLSEVEVFEGSLVGEPANTAAKITEVKSVVPFQDLPLAAQDRPWEESQAISRVRDFTESTESPSAEYRRAFLWYDKENADDFAAYQQPIADVISGRLTAVPRGIFAAAAALQGSRGGVDIPESDMTAVIRHVERYYSKMDLDSPFEDDEKQMFVADDVKEWSERDIEKFLKSTGKLSKSAAKILTSRIDIKKDEPEPIEVSVDFSGVMEQIKALKAQIAK